MVDCDLLNPGPERAARGDVCAAAVGNTANFGKLGAATIVNPEVLNGWGKRPGDYQWTVMVQQEIMPRVSAEVSYTRRDFHNFSVTDDLNRNVNTAVRDLHVDGAGGSAAAERRRLPDHRLHADRRRQRGRVEDYLTWKPTSVRRAELLARRRHHTSTRGCAAG